MCGVNVTNKNNFDVVAYTNALNPNLITEPFDLMEVYVKKGVNKLTGVTYTEFKEMTRYEQQIFLAYTNMLIEEENVVSKLTNEELDKQIKGKSSIEQNPADMLSGFNLGKDYI